MRILIIKTSSLGDIIQAFPVLQYLKECDPRCIIDWVAEKSFASLLLAHPLVNEVISIQTKKWRLKFLKAITWREIIAFRKKLRGISYDLVLDLQGNIKSGIVLAFTKSLQKVGFDFFSVAEWPNLLMTNQKYRLPLNQNIREDYLYLAQCAMGAKKGKEGGQNNQSEEAVLESLPLNLSNNDKSQLEPILNQIKSLNSLKFLVCFGSNWKNKQLSQETLIDFLQRLHQTLKVHFFFIWGNETEKFFAEELKGRFSSYSSLIPHLPFPALQCVMANADLVIAMDSLPLHLAGTTATPTYSIFGASSSQKYRPLGIHHQSFQGNCPYNKKFEKRCDSLRTCHTGACMKQIQGQDLFKHFYSWWSIRSDLKDD